MQIEEENETMLRKSILGAASSQSLCLVLWLILTSPANIFIIDTITFSHLYWYSPANIFIIDTQILTSFLILFMRILMMQMLIHKNLFLKKDIATYVQEPSELFIDLCLKTTSMLFWWYLSFFLFPNNKKNSIHFWRQREDC